MQANKMITANFSRAEVACKCGCGIDLISLELMCKLQESRDEFFRILNKGLVLNCVCRCPKHNADEGGEDKSAHLSTEQKVCQAADIKCINSNTRYVLFKILMKHFTRLEIGSTWIHVDVARDDDNPQEVIFLPKYAQRK
jgi:hypothetical protein